MTVAHIGTIAIPRGIVAAAWTLDDTKWINRRIRERDIFQGDKMLPIFNETLDRARKKFGLNDVTLTERSVIMFRDVSEHNDSWNDVRSPNGKRRRYVKAGFLHVFIAGKGTLYVGNKSVKFKRGDVIIHDPNVDHSVNADSKLCVSIVATVPLRHTLKVAKGISQ